MVSSFGSDLFLPPPVRIILLKQAAALSESELIGWIITPLDDAPLLYFCFLCVKGRSGRPALLIHCSFCLAFGAFS